jgi:hypothetical protein
MMSIVEVSSTPKDLAAEQATAHISPRVSRNSECTAHRQQSHRLKGFTSYFGPKCAERQDQ